MCSGPIFLIFSTRAFCAVRLGGNGADHARPREGRDAVGGHVVARHVERHHLGEAHDAELGRRVVGLADVAHEPGRRRHVDDASPLLLAHVGRRGPGHREAALQVRVDDAVPLLLGHVEDHAVAQDARVVHHDVDAAEVIERGLDDALPALHGGDRIVVGDGRAPAEGLDLADDLIGGRRRRRPRRRRRRRSR